MSNRRDTQRRAAWQTSQPRGRCTMPGLHARPVPTTHVVKWPWLGLRRLSGEPVHMRAFTCAAHARQLLQRDPARRAYRYRVTPAERETRLSARRVGCTMRRYFDAVDIVVDAIPDSHVQAQLTHTLEWWEDYQRRQRLRYAGTNPTPHPASGGWCAPDPDAKP